MNIIKQSLALGLLTAYLGSWGFPAHAQEIGITDTSVKLGTSFPLSGVAAVLGLNILSGAQAYFNHINEQGGWAGRKIELIALDDGYDPARMVGNVRRLVESDKVFAIFATGGTAHNLAIADYLNRNNVPHLFLNTSDPQFGDMAKYPWTVPWLLDFNTEMAAYAEYIKSTKPAAKIAILYQNDSYGQGGLAAFETAAKAFELNIVATESYLPSDPSVDVQVGKLARSGADVLIDVAIPKFAAQTIRRAAALQWRPMHFLQVGSASSELVLKPAGVQESQGIISAAYLKDPADPATALDPNVQQYVAAVKKYAPSVNPLDPFVVRGWAAAETLFATLKAAKESTRKSVLESARTLDTQISMMLVPLKTSPDNAFPISTVVIETFKGERFEADGPMITPLRRRRR
jgi:branched-chain amino acid transport system substrate-binding protein